MFFLRRLRDLRNDHDLTQQEVAQLIYMSQQQYSLYERGIRMLPIDCLVLLTNYYGTSTDYLIGLTDRKTPYPIIQGQEG